MGIHQTEKKENMDKTTESFAFDCPEWNISDDEENEVDQWFTEVNHKKHEAKKRRKSARKRRTLHRTPKKENAAMEDKENLEPAEVTRDVQVKPLEYNIQQSVLPRPQKRPKLMIDERPSISMSRLAQLARPKIRLANPDYPEKLDFPKTMRTSQPVKNKTSRKTTHAISPKLRTARRQRRLQVLTEN